MVQTKEELEEGIDEVMELFLSILKYSSWGIGSQI